MREPVEIHKRRMTPARRKRIIERHGGKCCYPGCETSDGLEIEHTVPIALGGRDDDDNLTAMCRYHHAQKTRLDVKMIAKAKRIQARENGTRRERPKIASRGFDKTKTKGFNGKVRDRT